MIAVPALWRECFVPKIIHLADAHIGATYESLPENVAEECRAAQMRCLQTVISRATVAQADAILIAGDLFDTPTPPLSLSDRVFAILAQAPCPVLISPGNHDYLHPASPYLTQNLPESVHVFDSPRLEAFALNDGCVVWGAAFTDMTANIEFDVVPDPRLCNILLVHADLLADTGYNPLTREKLETSGFTYAAVGHNHMYSGLKHAGYTVYACPGCLMGRGSHESGARGFLSGTVTRNELHLDFCTAGGVEFLSTEQPMTGIANDAELARALSTHVPENHARVCSTITLTGERSYKINMSSLREALAKIFLLVDVLDESRQYRDPWRYLQTDDLRGAVTRRFQKQADAATDKAARAQALYALNIALAALEEEPFPDTPQ